MDFSEIDSMLQELAPAPLTLVQQAFVDAASLLQPKGENVFAKYRTDPVGYARDVLKVTVLSDMQREILELIVKPQDDEWHGKLAVGSSVNYGKTFIGGVIVNFYFDCYGPCIIATTAPSQQSVKDLLWKEIRLLRSRADARWGIGDKDFIGPQATEMRRTTDWWARGYTASKGENFKGRHVENMMFMFDETCGLSELYFRATKLMFKSRTNMLWLAFFNPTDTSSAIYQELIRGDSTWISRELSALDHPNILAGLAGDPLPIPAAVSLEQLEEAILDDCEEVSEADHVATDFQWPPESGNWLRPGANFEGEFLGRWPSSDPSAIWSDGLWKAATKPIKWEQVRIFVEEIPRIGADIARQGEDKTEIHVSWQDYSVHHEARGKVDPYVTFERIIQVAEEWAERANVHRRKADIQLISAKSLPIMIDDDGVGGTISSFLRAQGYRVFPIGAATKAYRQNRYPNKRSELWFVTRDRAKAGKVHLGLLPTKVLNELRKQAMAPTWEGRNGMRIVEPKDVTKKRLAGRSPDGMDAVNLSYFEYDSRGVEVIHVESQGLQEKMAEQHSRPSLFGGRTTKRGLFRRG